MSVKKEKSSDEVKEKKQEESGKAERRSEIEVLRERLDRIESLLQRLEGEGCYKQDPWELPENLTACVREYKKDDKAFVSLDMQSQHWFAVRDKNNGHLGIWIEIPEPFGRMKDKLCFEDEDDDTDEDYDSTENGFGYNPLHASSFEDMIRKCLFR